MFLIGLHSDCVCAHTGDVPVVQHGAAHAAQDRVGAAHAAHGARQAAPPRHRARARLRLHLQLRLCGELGHRFRWEVRTHL